MKAFVISDMHSYYDEVISALQLEQFNINNPEHIIISCGDACDRGSQSKEMLEFLMDLYDKGRAILIRGNHEDLMDNAIYRKFFLSHDIHNKTTETVCQLTNNDDPDLALIDMKDNELWNKYTKACIDYYENSDYIFVHGWIPVDYKYIDKNKYKDLPDIYKPTTECYDKDWRESVNGEEARGLNGMKMGSKGITEPDKTIVCGHWHSAGGNANLHHDGQEFISSIETFYIDQTTGKMEPHVNYGPFIDNGIIAIDACTAVSKKVNVLVIDNFEKSN